MRARSLSALAPWRALAGWWRKPRPLWQEFSLVALAIAVGAVLLVSIVINSILGYMFNIYVREGLERRTYQLGAAVAEEYRTFGGPTSMALMEVTHFAMMEGVPLRLVETGGRTLWQSADWNPGAADQIISAVISDGTRPVARLEVQPPPNAVSFLNAHDLHFRLSVNRALAVTALVVALLAVLASVWAARALAWPLAQMTRAAAQMADGQWNQRVPTSDVREVADLGEAINRLAQTIEAQDEQRRRLTADLAHELRTPMTTILTHLEAMEDGVFEPTRERIRALHDEGQRLARLIGDFNRLCEAEADALNISLEQLDASELVSSLGVAHGPLFERDGKVLEVIVPGPIAVRWDPDKVKQIVANLLENARRYTGPDGRARLSVARATPRFGRGAPDGWVAIAVADNGPGIAAEHLPHIFDRLYRADPSRSRRTGGAGLGLAIARALSEAQGGRIEVESEPGRGSTFTLWLPTDAGSAVARGAAS